MKSLLVYVLVAFFSMAAYASTGEVNCDSKGTRGNSYAALTVDGPVYRLKFRTIFGERICFARSGKGPVPDFQRLLRRPQQSCTA